MAFSDDGTLLASGSDRHDDPGVDGQRRQTQSNVVVRPRDVVCSLAFIGKMLVSGSLDRTVKVWQDDKIIQSFQIDTSVFALCLSPDSSKLVAGCGRGCVRLFDVFFEARRTRRHNVYILLAHLDRVEAMTGYAKHYVQYHVLPELPWQAWLL